MNQSLQLGFFIQPVHPPTRAYLDVLTEDREAVVLADELGFREAFVGEHLADAAETITSSLAFISSLADRCPRIVFGTGVLPLPNYHPAMVAAQVAMVDHFVRGRLLLGVGPGVPSDAEVLDAVGPDRRLQLAEAIEQILAIWTGEPPYRLQGEFYRTTTERSWTREIGVGCFVKPFQRPHPPIVITSIRPDSEAPYTAGRRGWSGISATYVGEYVVRAHLEAYRAGRAAAGLSDETTGWRVARSIFVADDESTAADYALPASGAHGFYFRVMQAKLARFGALGLMGDSPNSGDLDLEHTLARLVIAGTPDQVADRIVAFRERVGPFGTLLYTGHDWVNPVLARRSMELMVREVWPRVLDRS